MGDEGLAGAGRPTTRQLDIAGHGKEMLEVERHRAWTRLGVAWLGLILSAVAFGIAIWALFTSIESLLDPLIDRKAKAGETLTLAFLAFRGSAIAALVAAAVSITRLAIGLLQDAPAQGAGNREGDDGGRERLTRVPLDP
jgi:hypothetical protein